jgi:outer membrane lipoprotein-sorting protein
MRKVLFEATALLLLAVSVKAQTAEEILAKFVKTVGGAEKISAIKTLRRTGMVRGGGGFEVPIVQENKRPGMVRREMTRQGLTGITAYDGKTGWKLEPWRGKKDIEPLSEEQLKSILEESDFDGPLINYKEKGNKVEFIGTEPVEGTDALKLKVTRANGDLYYYYMDTDYYVPIKIETKRMIRGAEREYETTLGDYKEVQGWYLPFSIESNMKGNPNRSVLTFESIEANVPIDDSRFAKPATPSNPTTK